MVIIPNGFKSALKRAFFPLFVSHSILINVLYFNAHGCIKQSFNAKALV